MTTEKGTGKIRIPGEAAYLPTIILIAFSVALTASADLGVSMIVGPAYILSLKFDFLTFGLAEYIVQGILFVIFGIMTLVTGIRFYLVKKDEVKYAALPAVVTVAFAVAGLVEWVYHLGHPMSFVLLLSITPLVFADLKGKNGRREGKENKAAV